MAAALCCWSRLPQASPQQQTGSGTTPGSNGCSEPPQPVQPAHLLLLLHLTFQLLLLQLQLGLLGLQTLDAVGQRAVLLLGFGDRLASSVQPLLGHEMRG